jgi:Cell wall binding domain 2 (CWB2)
VFTRLRYAIDDLRYAGFPRIALGVLGIVVLLGGAAYAVRELTREDKQPAPAPSAAVNGGHSEAAQDLGFPAFATKNTTRVGGAEPAGDAAGVALATHPSAGDIERPAAVTLVPSDDWAAGVAASALVAAPIGAPLLVSGPDDVPDQTATALDALSPQGSGATGDAQVFQIGAAKAPSGLKGIAAGGPDPAAIANAIDGLRRRLTGDPPEHVVVASTKDPAFAMPAAAWAARSGDPVLFVERNSVPKLTLAALRADKGAGVYLLGPPSVASNGVLSALRKVAPGVRRIAGNDPVANAIAFARYDGGGFGWNITDPGHGLVIADASRPLDAAAAAPLSASGKWGPLLVTDSSDVVPPALKAFLLDIKPGYRDDPTRAFYNHAWLIGDAGAISVGFQAEVDGLLELATVHSGNGGPVGTESEPAK